MGHSGGVISPHLFCIFLIALLSAKSRGGSDPVAVPQIPNAALRQTEDGDGYGGEGYTVRPLLDETPLCTAIIIHGLGGTGQEWGVLSLGMSIFSLNYVKFIIPSAESRPVTYLNKENIPSWFDIQRIQGTNSQINQRELTDSVARMNAIINGEIEAGVPADRIFIIGFSQGGALALTTFLRSQRPLGGCVGVATWLPVPTGDIKVSKNIEQKDILMVHGTEDEAVDFQYGKLSAMRIENDLGVTVNFTEIPGAPHIILSADIIQMIEDYIASRAPGTRNYLRSLVQDLTDSFGSVSSRLQKPKLIPIL